MCVVNRMIIHFFKASFPYLFLHLIMALSGECGLQFRPPTNSDDLCFPFCQILILCFKLSVLASVMTGQAQNSLLSFPLNLFHFVYMINSGILLVET